MVKMCSRMYLDNYNYGREAEKASQIPLPKISFGWTLSLQNTLQRNLLLLTLSCPTQKYDKHGYY